MLLLLLLCSVLSNEETHGCSVRRTCSSSEEEEEAAAVTAGASSNVASCSYSSSNVVVVVIDNALRVVQSVSATRWGVVGSSSKGRDTCVRTNVYDAGTLVNVGGTFQRDETGADDAGGGSTTDDETPEPQVDTEAADDNETASLLVPRTRRWCGGGGIAAKEFGGGGNGRVEAGRGLLFSAVPVDDVDESRRPCGPVLEDPTITERYAGASSSILFVVAVTVPTAAACFFAG